MVLMFWKDFFINTECSFTSC